MKPLSEQYTEIIGKADLHRQAEEHIFQRRILGKRSKEVGADQKIISLIVLNLIQLQAITRAIEEKIKCCHEVNSVLQENIDPVLLDSHKNITNDIDFLQGWLVGKTTQEVNLCVCAATQKYVDHIETLDSPQILAHWYTLILATLFGGMAFKSLIRHLCYPILADNNNNEARQNNGGATYYSFDRKNIFIIRNVIDKFGSDYFNLKESQHFLNESCVVFQLLINIMDEMEGIVCNKTATLSGTLQQDLSLTYLSRPTQTISTYLTSSCCFWTAVAGIGISMGTAAVSALVMTSTLTR